MTRSPMVCWRRSGETGCSGLSGLRGRGRVHCDGSCGKGEDYRRVFSEEFAVAQGDSA